MNTPISRREFFKSLAKLGLGAAVLPPALKALFEFHENLRAETPSLKEASYYTKMTEGKIQCTLCPNMHILKDGEVQVCNTRINKKGMLYTLAYNNPCVLNIDPIEKGPFHHIRPGTNTVALGVGGCNLRCLYCQNWNIAMERPDRLKNLDMPKEKILEAAKDKECKTVIFTFTEPSVYPEYVKEVTAYTAEKKILNVICTSGFINAQPLKDVCKNVHGFTVTLKAFNDKFYQKICGQTLKPVLSTMETIKSEKRWLEIVNLIVPGYNDDMKVIKEMCEWIKKTLGEDTPIHLGRFVPQYKLKDLPPTPLQTIDDARKIGQDAGLKYVYAFNVAPHDGNNTYCPKCKKIVIKRLAFKILEDLTKKGKCPCGYQLPGIWE
jgi:pyruvate formate lyase activating enzyme